MRRDHVTRLVRHRLSSTLWPYSGPSLHWTIVGVRRQLQPNVRCYTVKLAFFQPYTTPSLRHLLSQEWEGERYIHVPCTASRLLPIIASVLWKHWDRRCETYDFRDFTGIPQSWGRQLTSKYAQRTGFFFHIQRELLRNGSERTFCLQRFCLLPWHTRIAHI